MEESDATARKVIKLRQKKDGLKGKRFPPYQRIVKVCEEGFSIASKPDDKWTFAIDIAWSLENSGQYDKAVLAYEQAQSVSYHNAYTAWVTLQARARTKAKKRDLAGALRDYNILAETYFTLIKGSPERADRYSFDGADAWKCRAEVQYELALLVEDRESQQQLFNQLISGFDDLMRTNTLCHHFWWFRGDIYVLLERYHEAIADYTKACTILGDTKSPAHIKISGIIENTKKLIEDPPKKKPLKTQPTYSTPPAFAKTQPPSQPTPSAPPAGTKTRVEFFKNHVLPSAPPHTQAPSDPVMGTHTQEILVKKNWGYIDPKKIRDKKLIGEGGAGSVHRAMWEKHVVAIKVTHANVDQARIKREHELIFSCDHPNIIHSFGYTIENNVYHLVMELHPRSLSDFLLKERHPMVERIACANDIARGLVYLHDNHVLHLDLKPDNVLISADKRAVIADFGISRKLDPDQSHQSTTNVSGTITYMAPELFGQNPQYSELSDIYADALVNWSCLTRQHPYQGMQIGTILQEVVLKDRRPIIPENDLEREMPNLVTGNKGIAHLIRQCWDKDPKHRPRAKQVSERLEAIHHQLLKK